MLITDELLLNYKRCRRRTYLEVYGNRQQQDPDKEFLLKLKRESQIHIRHVLTERSLFYQQPAASRRDWQLNSQATVAMMEQGVDCIKGGLLHLSLVEWNSWLGEDGVEIFGDQDFFDQVGFLAAPTLLIKQPGESKFGNWLYTPFNIKLGRRPKPEYKLIAAFHSQMLGTIQGTESPQSTLILRQHRDYVINRQYWLPKMQDIVKECIEMLATQSQPEVFISRQRCSLCHWHGYCHEIAKSQQHLSLVPGVTPKRYENLVSLGITSLEALTEVPEFQLSEAIGEHPARQLKQQAISLIQNRPLIKSECKFLTEVELPSADIELYFDIEAEPERNVDYLLGVLLVDRTQKIEQFHYFLAETPEAEAEIWQQFLDFVLLYPDAPIFHYSEYEIDTIKRLSRLYGTPKMVTKILLSRFIDIHYLVTNSVILPVESYSLKSLANWIGFRWREDKASGDQCVCWYDQWLATQERSFLDAILSYNEDDCRATHYLKDWLVNFWTISQPAASIDS